MAKKLVITGGPCAGKTSSMEILRAALANIDSCVLFVPEAATDLILSGISPRTCPSVLDFQTQVIALQIEREIAADAAADEAMLSDGKNAVVICDRGICDSRAYLSAGDYARALAANGLDAQTALERYDAVFYLDSIASTNPDAYTCSNNSARVSDAQEAALADARTFEAWSAHPHVIRIGNESVFEQKMSKLVSAIMRHAS